MSAQERVSASTVEIADDGFDDFGRRAKGGRKDKTAKEMAALARLQSNYGFLMNPLDAASALGQFEDAPEARMQPPIRANNPTNGNLSGARSSGGQDKSDSRRRVHGDDLSTHTSHKDTRDSDRDRDRRRVSRSRSRERTDKEDSRRGGRSDDRSDERYRKHHDRSDDSRRRSRSRERDSRPSRR